MSRISHITVYNYYKVIVKPYLFKKIQISSFYWLTTDTFNNKIIMDNF